MGMFDQWKNFFSVGNTISQSSNTQPDDVFKTKSALVQTGDYKVPDFGITDIPDMGMIDGLKRFQQKNGLKVDGVMKPGGPTEAKLGETMANQGVTNTDLLETAKPKPKMPKIDPLTGLSEVKMPKLKINPWFQSSKLKPVEDEAHSANTRTMDGLLQYSKNGSLPALYADSLKNGGQKAFYEYANFMQQLSDREGKRVDEFHQEVVSRLPENMKQVFAQLELDNGGNETQVGTNTEPQFSERVKAHSAENVQRGEDTDEKPPAGEGGQTETKSVPRSEETCINEELDHWVAEQEYQHARNAMQTVDTAIDDANKEINDLKNYDMKFPHPNCKAKMPKVRVKKKRQNARFKGRRVEVDKFEVIGRVLEVQLCSAIENGKIVINKNEKIRELEEHLQELKDVKTDLQTELDLLRQGSDNTAEIYRRCQKKKGKK